MTPPTAPAAPLLVSLLLSMALVASAGAQDTDPPDPLPTLDELLGLDTFDAPDAGEPAPPTRAEEELQRLLTGEEIAGELATAVDLMDRSARRLTSARDTSITTQRMQEDVLRALDKLIADAQRRGQQSSSSSSSSSSQQQQQSAQQPRQQSAPTASNQNTGEATPPGRADGPLGPERAADLATWGNLPARLRDALVQGAGDRFSATYRRLTEEYYRKLAEDPEQ